MYIKNFIKQITLAMVAVGFTALPVAAENGTIYFNHQASVQAVDAYNSDDYGDPTDNPKVIFTGARTKSVKSNRGGSRIAYLRKYEATGNFNLIVANADGSHPVNITGDGGVNVHSFDWDYAGTKLAYSQDGDIYTVNYDGSDISQLTNTANAETHPAYSHLNKWLAYNRDNAGNQEIYVYTFSTETTSNETNNAADDFISKIGNPWRSTSGNTKLFFHSDRNGNFDIFKMDPDGTHITRLTSSSGDDINATPAGALSSQFAYLNEAENDYDLVLMTTTGFHIKSLSTIGYVTRFDWSPDGNWLTYAQGFIYTIKRDGSLRHKVAHKTGVLGINWSAHN